MPADVGRRVCRSSRHGLDSLTRNRGPSVTTGATGSRNPPKETNSKGDTVKNAWDGLGKSAVLALSITLFSIVAEGSPFEASVLVPGDHGVGIASEGFESTPGEAAAGTESFMAFSPSASCDGSNCASGSSCAEPADGWFNRILGPACPRWVVQVDALMLWQGNIASRPLLVGPGSATVLDVNQTQTEMAAGPRYGLFCNLDDTYAIEGNYFNVGIFPGDVPFTPAGTYTPVNLPPPVALPATPTAYNLFSQARIQSAELNWRRRDCALPITWLAGFRWVEWNQVLQFSDAALPPMTGTTNTTGNDLYGGQIGADLNLWDAGRWLWIDGIGKAGVFYNTAYQRSYGIVDQQGSSTLLGPTTAVAQQTSFFGEVGANATVRVCRWLAWRVGYSVFWLSAVAVPADQLALTSLTPPPGTATINTNGSVLLHGVTTGLEARW